MGLNRDEFRKWLSSFHPEEVVADDWGFCDCPLARWLSPDGDAYVEPDWEYGVKGFYRLKDSPDEPLPLWANEFGTFIDDYNGCEPVSASQCLAVLARCST